MANFDAPIFNGEGRGDDPNPIEGNYQGFSLNPGPVNQLPTDQELKDAPKEKGKKPQLTPEERAERAMIYRTRSSQKKKKEEQDRKEKLSKLEKENKKLWKGNGSLKKKLESHSQDNVKFKTHIKQLEHDYERNRLLLLTVEEKLYQSDTNTFHREIVDLQTQLEIDRAYAEATVLPYVEQHYELRIENVQLKQKIKELELKVDALLNDKIAKEKNGKELQE